MATDEQQPQDNALLSRVRELAADVSVPEGLGVGDFTRAGIEAMVAQEAGTARVLNSTGHLRFTGVAVVGHSAELDTLARLSQAWQRAVSAIGAAVEGIKTVRGQLPTDVVRRTRLMLTASPAPGSVVFHIEPKESPMLEAEPGGQPAITDEVTPRPLADQASSLLVELLYEGGKGELSAVDALASHLSELGPRVGSAIDRLARAIEDGNVTLDVAWREPARPTRRAVVTPAQAKFIAQVVEGRGLNAGRETFVGNLATISDRQQWVLELGDKTVHLDMSELETADLTRWKVRDLVEVDVRTAVQERPDGRVDRRYTMLAIRPASGPLTLLQNDEDA